MDGAGVSQAEGAVYKHRVWWAPIALAVASACWGVSVPLTKKVVDVIPPVTLLASQLFISVLVLWAAILIKPKSTLVAERQLDRQDLYRACLSGVLQPGATFLLVTLGLLLTKASEVVLLDAIEPIIIMGFAAVLLRERLSGMHYLCALVAICGAVLVILPQIDMAAMSWAGLVGDLLVFAGLFVAAFYVILSRQLISAYDGLRLAALQQSAAFAFAILAVIAAPLFGSSPWPTGEVTDDVVWVVILSGLLQFALPFWLYLQALRYMRASVTALFLPIIPLSGVATAYFLLNETLNIGQWLGAALIVSAVLAASLNRSTSH